MIGEVTGTTFRSEGGQSDGIGAPSIFVSIAAYRDPQLIPTIADCLAKARLPQRLSFGICWQHGPQERLPDWFEQDRFRVLDVDWRESRGACWARAEIMKLWEGEDWFLQLDSHHRFVEDWDVLMLEQAAATGSPKPVLSASAPRFTLDGAFASEPLLTGFHVFDEGIPIPMGVHFPNWRPGLPPRRVSFISAHFLLAPGRFVEEVPYDPELYFGGEEAAMSVRAFTHGYDLFQPCEILLWHEYTRSYRTKHWEDHTPGRGLPVAWYERDAASRGKVRRLFEAPAVGRYGLGQSRTLADYEAYAGISVRHRRAQDYTRRHLEPPNPRVGYDWATRVRDHRIEIAVDRGELAPAALEDPLFWYIGMHDGDGREIFRRDADGEELKAVLETPGDRVSIVREFESEAEPVTWTVRPHSRSQGWLKSLTRSVPGQGMDGGRGPPAAVGPTQHTV